MQPLLPLYTSNSEAGGSYANLKTTYYLFRWDTDYRLDIYFSATDDGETDNRVARLLIYSAGGQLVNLGETVGELIPIVWSSNEQGSTCNVVASETEKDQVSGQAYRSCLFWIDKDGYGYKLYTVWSVADATVFANGLLRVDGALSSPVPSLSR